MEWCGMHASNRAKVVLVASNPKWRWYIQHKNGVGCIQNQNGVGHIQNQNGVGRIQNQNGVCASKTKMVLDASKTKMVLVFHGIQNGLIGQQR
jgi:hypothetical protein